MGIRGLLVDMDGTLADSIVHLKAVFFDFLHSHGIQGTEEEFTQFLGATLEEIIRHLKGKYALDGSEKELFGQYTGLILQAYRTNVKPMPGAADTIKWARRNGIKLAVVTAATEDIVRSFLLSSSLDGVFDVLVCAQEGEKGKPDPALFKRGLKALGLAPEEAVAIEDSTNGVHSALGANCETLWLTQENQPTVSESLHLMKSWQEIEAWLKARV